MRRLSVLGVALALPFLIASLPSAAGSQQAKSKPAPPAQSGPAKASAKASTLAKDPAQYVGAEACKTCHEDIFKSSEKTLHWDAKLKVDRALTVESCEACHGPGAEHVSSGGEKSKIFVFKTAAAKEVSERCLECHATGKEQMNFARSVHNLSKVNCLDCHTAHHPKTAEFLLVKKQPELCYTCHLEAKPQFNMPFHHRVNEGLVKCSDCHNPHGTLQAKQLRVAASQDAACFNCHVDKAGPFVYEHAPVKTEGCVACHVPHGSSNPHLLKFSQVNLLCLQCHTVSSFSAAPGTPSFHNQKTQFQACTLCHVQIHGSNFDFHFFK